MLELAPATLDDISFDTWNSKYRWKSVDDQPLDLTVEDTWRRVSDALAGVETSDVGKWQDKFYGVLSSRRFLPAGRILTGAGTGMRTTLFNCFVMGTIEDSMEGILESHKESMLSLRMGGGVGMDFSTLRPHGAPVHGVNSTASGPLTFMDIWDTGCRTIMGAGTRRGAMMATMRCDHPDIEAFIEAKMDKARFRNFNLSVLVTDDFMACVKAKSEWTLRFEGVTYKTIKADILWEKIMRSTYDSAEPGVIFIDRVNDMNNLYYCESISSTNPCFTGDTKVWTDRGHIEFRDLIGKTVNVLTQTWDGQLVYRPMSDIRVTQRKAQLVEVRFTDGQRVRCTPNHMFFLKAGGQMEAKRLQPGVSIASVYRYTANQKGYMRLTNGQHQPLEHHVPFEGGVPVGYQVHHKDEVKHHNWADNLELLTPNDHAAIHMSGDRNPMRRFPEKNHFNNGFYGETNGRWRSDLSTHEMLELRAEGMPYYKIAEAVGCSKYTVMKRVKEANHTVAEVIWLEELEDVYCGSVDEFNRFFVSLGSHDGVLVHNCGEQPLPPYGACLLGSVNLTAFVEDPFNNNSRLNLQDLRETVAIAIRMMDNVVDASRYPLEQQEKEAKNKRRLGLGVTGLGNALAMCRLRYGSEEAARVAESWMYEITCAAYSASVELAKEKGAFPLFDASQYSKGKFIQCFPISIRKDIKNFGIRNSHLTSIAPTGTISLFAGNLSSGVEPPFAFEFNRKVLRKDGNRESLPLEDFAYGLYRKMYPDRGKELPSYFVTAQDLKPEEHLRMLAAVQKYVDSSVSKTINLPRDIEFKDFKDVYRQAYDLGIKSCTTYRPNDITGAILEVAPTEKAEDKFIAVAAVQNFQLLINPPEREESLPGKTYKLKWPGSDHAIYVTINDIFDEYGGRRPYEVFINSKNMEHFSWTVALTRMISAVFRRGGNVRFVVEELKAIFDPRGGEWVNGKYVPSLLAHIGGTIERHMIETGFITGPIVAVETLDDVPTGTRLEQCPKCGEAAIIRQEGCNKCMACDYSKCS